MIFALYDNAGVDIDVFDRCLSVLDDRGHDGKESIVDRPIAVGYQHFYTDTREECCRQPISDTDTIIAFDGRIDNRRTLTRKFSYINDDLAAVEIFKCLFDSVGEQAFQEIVGPFFALAYEKDTETLVCGRDTIGLRHIFYCYTGERFLIASSPDAILRAIESTPDRDAIAGYLSENGKYAGYTFHTEIEALDRGSFLRYDGDTAEEISYHQFRSQREYSHARPDRFREALESAVCSRISQYSRPGVALSGGRDSNTVAAVVVNDCGATPRTYSHVSKNEFECERIETEMQNIGIMDELYSFDSHRIWIDDYDFDYERCLDSYSFGLPVLDPYLAMQIQLYERAAENGKVVLDGFGGNCFDGTGLFYYDLLRTGQLGQLVDRAYRDDGTTLANLFSAVLPSITSFTPSPAHEPSWLQFDPPSSDVTMDVKYLEQQLMLRFLFKRTKNLMRFQAQQAARKNGIDLRFPLMDERLHREVLKMPPGSLRKRGQSKGLFLEAVDGLLPPEIESFEIGMGFDPFLEEGLENYGYPSIEKDLQSLHTDRLGVVDGNVVRSKVLNLSTSPSQLWKLFTIERWLTKHQNVP